MSDSRLERALNWPRAIWQASTSFSRKRCITLWMPFVFSLVTAASAGFVYADDTDLVQFLCSVWKSQRSEIVTAQLKYRLVRQARGNLATLSPKEVRDLVDSVDVLEHPDDLKDLVAGLNSTPLKSEKPWGLMESTFYGTKVREERLGKSASHSIQAFDGDVKIEYDAANKQAVVFTPGTSRRHVTRLSEFRKVPNPDVAVYSVVGRSEGRATLSSGISRLVVDEITGALYNMETRYDSGGIREDLIQKHFVTYPGGIIFPNLSVRAYYGAEGTLVGIHIFSIVEATFNADVSDSAFAVPVPANTQVFDKRSAHRVRSFRLNQSLDNVTEIVGQQSLIGPDPQGSFKWWLVVGNVLVVVAGLVLFFVIRPFWKARKSS